MTTTDSAVTAVLDEVTGLVDTLRKSGPEAEERRWIPDENIELLDKAGVYRLAVPRRFGGLEAPVADQVRILGEIARADTATGWVSMIWVSSAWVPSLFPDKAQEEVYAGGAVRVSTGFTPSGTLTAAEDGSYTLSGSWKWLSGARGANWALLSALLVGPDGTPAPFAALVPFSELSIADDWHAAYGAGTGSSTATAENVSVPAHRVASLIEILGGTTGGRANTGATGRNYAFVPFFMAQGASAYIGIAKGAYELFLDRLPGRGITYTSWTDQSQSPVTQIQVAIAANKIAAAEALQDNWLRRLQEHADAGTGPSVEERAAARGTAAFAIQLAKEAVDELFEASGASVIMRDVPFQRYHRDIRGLALHALFAFNTNQEVHGRAILGLAPDTPFL
ncbi:acyl-CoA dehydrogenase family protein [Streptomyces zaomyceticus]|uniref:Acyl-CoA dehydrogenase family protein n=1 Tax=Streptomyces zaomyceticus TaxID=68286 RepID=A0ABZ1L062_9ACTN|nr:acyl-CoA dehydrogenase family protein [Streptomyces zaomyceticus]WSQ23414.1 acyl-CoA dehydrogenase family protein [Streptomyces zaomyceticus]